MGAALLLVSTIPRLLSWSWHLSMSALTHLQGQLWQSVSAGAYRIHLEASRILVKLLYSPAVSSIALIDILGLGWMKFVNQPHLLALLRSFSESRQKSNQKTKPKQMKNSNKKPPQMWIVPIPGSQVVWTAIKLGTVQWVSLCKQPDSHPATHSSF